MNVHHNLLQRCLKYLSFTRNKFVMKHHLYFSMVCISLCLTFSAAAFSQQSFDNWLKNPLLKNASVGLLVIDARTGDTLFQHNPRLSLTPASCMKLFSTATALEVLGKDYSFSTEIACSGVPDSAGTLHGNVYIIGYGDPCLGSDRFADYYLKPLNFIGEWVKAIKNAGIKKIDGCVIGDPSQFCYPFQPGSWLYEDVGNYYGAPVSGLSIYENMYKLHFGTGISDGDSTLLLGMEPQIPGYTFINKVISATKGGDQSFIIGGSGCSSKTIIGSLPVKQTRFTIKGSVDNPPLWAAQLLSEALAKNGVTVTQTARSLPEGEYRPPVKVLYTTKSPPLKRICDATNLWSLNLYAEHLAIASAQQLQATPTTWFPKIVEFWKNKGMDTDGLQMMDGSGLSVFNTVTVSQLVYLLRYMHYNAKTQGTLMTTLPVAGNSGTLTRYCQYGTGKGKIHAKGGSMKGVRAMAGYARPDSGKEIVFAVIINHYDDSKGDIKKHVEDLLNIIAAL